MGGGELLGVDVGLGPVDATVGLELADEADLVGVDQPVPGRHRRAVVEERGVAQHDRITVRPADRDLIAAARLATQQRSDPGVVTREVGHRSERAGGLGVTGDGGRAATAAGSR